MTPNKDRKAQERARRRAAGLLPIEVWAHPDHHEAIRRYVARLTKKLIVVVKAKA